MLLCGGAWGTCMPGRLQRDYKWFFMLEPPCPITNHFSIQFFSILIQIIPNEDFLPSLAIDLSNSAENHSTHAACLISQLHQPGLEIEKNDWLNARFQWHFIFKINHFQILPMTFWFNRLAKTFHQAWQATLTQKSMNKLHLEWKAQHHKITALLHEDSFRPLCGILFLIHHFHAALPGDVMTPQWKVTPDWIIILPFNLSVRSSSPLTSLCQGVTVIQREKCSMAGNPGDRTPLRMSRPPRCGILMAIKASSAAEKSAGVNTAGFWKLVGVDLLVFTGFKIIMK